MEEKLKEIGQVKDVKTPRTANKYLAQGWVLLEVYTEHSGNPTSPEDYVTHYVLGEPKEETEG
jgi:hypothetical protein